MDTDLINTYISKLNDAVVELTKKNIVLEASLEHSQTQLAAKDNETEAKLAQVRSENLTATDGRLDDIQRIHDSEMKTVLKQRADLQNECNQLRTNYAKLETAYIALTEKPPKKKKVVAAI